jgi:bacterial/archaeal transporter family-2 protein
MNQIVFALLAFGAGCCIALQASANGRFRQNLASSPADGAPEYVGPIWATFLSICGTILCAMAVMLVLRPPLPSKAAFQSTQWWNWIGGPLGALIVLAGATIIPKLGAAKFIALVVAGQLLSSVLMDHFGLLGLTVQPINSWKAVGVLLVVAGVICIKYL